MHVLAHLLALHSIARSNALNAIKLHHGSLGSRSKSMFLTVQTSTDLHIHQYVMTISMLKCYTRKLSLKMQKSTKAFQLTRKIDY